MLNLNTTLQAAIDLLPDAVIVVNEDISIEAANLQVLEIFGYQPQELVQKPLNLLIPERYHKRHDQHFRHYFKAPVKRRMGEGYELFGLHKSGREVDVDIALAPVQIDGKLMAMALIRDVTELKTLSRDLLKKNEELSLANTRLERLGYVIAHDLKSPLLNIHAILNLLKRELGENITSKTGNYIHVINQIAKSMMNLITGVAEYSKIGFQDQEDEAIDLNDVLQEVCRLVQFPPHFQLEVKSKLPVVSGNRTKMLQIFLNLLNNAVKYNNKPEGRIEIQAKAAENAFEIEISDNGPGVPAALRNSIFELFRKGAIEKEGSQGIGLAVIKKIIEDRGGHIAVDSSPLGGARFTFSWPVSKSRS